MLVIKKQEKKGKSCLLQQFPNIGEVVNILEATELAACPKSLALTDFDSASTQKDSKNHHHDMTLLSWKKPD